MLRWSLSIRVLSFAGSGLVLTLCSKPSIRTGVTIVSFGRSIGPLDSASS